MPVPFGALPLGSPSRSDDPRQGAGLVPSRCNPDRMLTPLPPGEVGRPSGSHDRIPARSALPSIIDATNVVSGRAGCLTGRPHEGPHRIRLDMNYEMTVKGREDPHLQAAQGEWGTTISDRYRVGDTKALRI